MTGRRENNKNVTPGQWLYLRKEEHPAGVNPKLTEQATGPYDVIETDGRTFVVRVGDTNERVSSIGKHPLRLHPWGIPIVYRTRRIHMNLSKPMLGKELRKTSTLSKRYVEPSGLVM
jgi:hypothetical protein